VIAATELAELPPPDSMRAARSAMKAVSEIVAEHLRNTPTVSRNSYIHPALFDAYQAGDFGERWGRTSARGSSWLTVDERRLLRVLPSLERRRAA
jgi:DNA topoisomerase-1